MPAIDRSNDDCRYAYHLQLVAGDLPWGERADAGDAAFSRFLSVESGWLQPLSDAERAAMREVPTDIIYGEVDFIPTGGAAPMKAALKPGGCHCWVIPGANHHMYARHADVFNKLVAGVAPQPEEAHEMPEEVAAGGDGGAAVGGGGIVGPSGSGGGGADRSPSPAPTRGGAQP